MYDMDKWENFGDVSIRHGQAWIRYGGDDYADCVEIFSAEEIGDGPDNGYVIRAGTIYFSPRHWKYALECCGFETYGPPEYWQVAYAFKSYSGIDIDLFHGQEIVQVGKRDSFGDLSEWKRDEKPDTILNGNASIKKYLHENYLQD